MKSGIYKILGVSDAKISNTITMVWNGYDFGIDDRKNFYFPDLSRCSYQLVDLARKYRKMSLWIEEV